MTQPHFCGVDHLTNMGRQRTDAGAVTGRSTSGPPQSDQESETSGPSRASTLKSKIDTVLQAVTQLGEALTQTRTSLEGRIDKVKMDFTLLHADHKKLTGRVGDIEK